MHKCPIDGCTALCPYHLLACPRHWRMVPGELKTRVYAAWNGYQDGTVGHADYMAVRQEAIDAVNQALGART